jgi:hypothetical protein
MKISQGSGGAVTAWAFGKPAELGVAEISRGDGTVPALVADEPKRCASRGWARRVPVNGGVGDVAPAGPHAFAQSRHIGPAESRTRILVVRGVGPDAVVVRCIADDIHEGS